MNIIYLNFLDNYRIISEILDIKNNLGVDFMSVSGHKIGALKGIGFLYKKNGIEIEPLIYGTQEKGMRGSTENVVGIISLGKALELYEVDFEKIVNCREYIINELIDRKNVKINGHRFIRLPNNISITLKDNTHVKILLKLKKNS